MSTITTKDGTQIFYKDWGLGQPIVFHHGWPLSSDGWDNQMLYFMAQAIELSPMIDGVTVVSTWTDTGNDMDTYAADVADLVAALDLKNAIHIGHSTGGSSCALCRRPRQGRVAKAVLISAIPPVMVKSANNPGGTPLEVFDGYRNALARNRAQFYLDVAGSGPFYGFNRAGAKTSKA